MKQHVKNFLQVKNASIPDYRLKNRIREADPLPGHFIIVVWNIFKRFGAEIFDKDIVDLQARSDILCLQEVLFQDSPYLPSCISEVNYHYGISYQRPDNFSEGLLTASPYYMQDVAKPLLSIAREPITRTPKSALICVLTVEQGRELLLINIHMLLFKRAATFKNELLQVMEACQEYHYLPAIFCGDFNTFTQPQLALLDSVLAEFNFERCQPFHAPRSKRYLDHIYIRDLTLLNLEVIDTIASSDHYPLICELRF